MTKFSSILAVSLLSVGSSAQNVTIPATDGSLPAAGSNGCAPGYYPGVDTVIYTVPYTYKQVLSIIGNYTNLTWSGSPANSVTTNNTAALSSNDWTPGTARTYDLDGAHVIETITTYSKPADGPYVEIHTLAPLRVPSLSVDLYAAFDGQVWAPVCGGKATWTNFTAVFCATNATVGKALFHELHSTDAITVGKFLGGKNFTSCADLGASGSSPYPTNNGTTGTSSGGSGSSNGSSTGSPPAEVTTSGSLRVVTSLVSFAVPAVIAMGLMMS